MTYRPNPASLTATAAIAAALALSATPAFAQDAAPVVIDAAPATATPAPVPAPASAPVSAPPRIELPSDLTTPITGQTAMPAAPVIAAPDTASTSSTPDKTSSQPRAAAQPARSTRTASAPSAAPARTAAPAPATNPMDADLAPVSAVPVTAPAAPAPIAEAPVVEAPAQAPAEDSGNALAIAAILAGLVGIGAAGTLAMRRRYRGSIRDDTPVYEPAYEPAPMIENAGVPAAVTSAAPAEAPTAEPVPVREYAVADAGDTHSTGWAVAQEDVAMPLAEVSATSEAFAMPEGPVPTGAARQALIDRMVAAQPDAANPFKSVPARRKRARIILQAREYRQRQDATRPFDFRTYRPSMERSGVRESVDA